MQENNYQEVNEELENYENLFSDNNGEYEFDLEQNNINKDDRENEFSLIATKRLIKQKLYRKGFMETIIDDEKTSEDLLKDTNISKQIEAQEKDDNIIASSDIETLMSDMSDLLEVDSGSADILKGDSDG